MSGYLKGHEVIKVLDIVDFEFLELIQKGLLQPYNRSGHKVCDKKIKLKYQVRYIEGRRLYKLKSKLKWAKEELKNLKQNTDQQSLLSVRGILEGLPNLEAKIYKLENKGIKPLRRIYHLQPEKIFPDELKDCLDWEYFDLPSDKNDAKRIIKRFLNFFYEKSEIDRLLGSERKENAQKPQAHRTQAINRKRKLSVSDATEWRALFVRVVINERLEFEYGNNYKFLTYIELGLDRKPAIKKLLKNLVRDGFLKYDSAERANVSNLRKIFKDLFPRAEGDPFPKKDNTWKPAFRFSI